jgi:hypothetical protein
MSSARMPEIEFVDAGSESEEEHRASVTGYRPLTRFEWFGHSELSTELRRSAVRIRRLMEHMSTIPQPVVDLPRGVITITSRGRFRIVPRSVEVRDEFHKLAEEWKEASAFESSTTRIVMHRAYQRIIGLGSDVVPWILDDLATEPWPWFWALSAITGDDPAEGEDTVEGAAARWLAWGREHGYLE